MKHNKNTVFGRWNEPHNPIAVQTYRHVLKVSDEHNFVQLACGDWELVHVPTGSTYTFRPGDARSPYMRTSVMIDGKKRTLYQHRLVCEAVNGPAPFSKALVDHVNRDKLDNRPENLRWATSAQNNLNTYRSDVVAIRRLVETSRRRRKLETQFARAIAAYERAAMRLAQ